jgi:predicted MFS family arabinose efflux permease
MFFLTLLFVREEPVVSLETSATTAARGLLSALRSPAVIGVAAFLFLWNFDLCSNTLLYLYMTESLGFSEETYGSMTSLQALGSVLGSIGYGLYCRRLSLVSLFRLAVLMGIVSTGLYTFMDGHRSAWVVSLLVGFSYTTGMLVQFDLAARVVPLAASGTVFAFFMSVGNTSTSLSMWLSGWLFDGMKAQWSPRVGFVALVLAETVLTAFCWLLLPILQKEKHMEIETAVPIS